RCFPKPGDAAGVCRCVYGIGRNRTEKEVPMNPRRVGVLLFREVVQGPKNFIFIFAIVVPLALSFILSALFGTLFSDKPSLGITDAGDSQFTRSAAAAGAFTLREYTSEAE